MVHGDDFVTSGSREDVKWLQQMLEKRFEIKTTTVGPKEDRGEVKEARILNRIIRITEDVWEYETSSSTKRVHTR